MITSLETCHPLFHKFNKTTDIWLNSAAVPSTLQGNINVWFICSRFKSRWMDSFVIASDGKLTWKWIWNVTAWLPSHIVKSVDHFPWWNLDANLQCGRNSISSLISGKTGFLEFSHENCITLISECQPNHDCSSHSLCPRSSHWYGHRAVSGGH